MAAHARVLRDIPSMATLPAPRANDEGLASAGAPPWQAWLDEASALLSSAKSPIEGRRLLEALDRARDIIAAQRDEIARLERLSLVDGLTGIYNGRGFDWQLQATLDECRRTGQGGVLIYVDLDGFKAINDAHGHAAGDAVLKEVARVLATRVRRHDSVGRLGGDEFAALLVRTSEAHGLERAAEIERAIAGLRCVCADQEIAIAASVGVVAFETCEDAATLLDRADRAMYAKKRARKARHARGSMPAIQLTDPCGERPGR
jgi:diguanylate cyclase (GGDEF)-like protein